MDIRHLFVVYMDLLWTSASSHMFKSYMYFFSVNFLHLCPFSCTPITEKLLNNYPYQFFHFFCLIHPWCPHPPPFSPRFLSRSLGNLVAVSRGKSSVHMLPGPELPGPAHLLMAPSSLTLLLNPFSEHLWFSFYLSTLSCIPDFLTLTCPWCQSLDWHHAWQRG